jgi:(2Fe-2S) ferredoxin
MTEPIAKPMIGDYQRHVCYCDVTPLNMALIVEQHLVGRRVVEDLVFRRCLTGGSERGCGDAE